MSTTPQNLPAGGQLTDPKSGRWSSQMWAWMRDITSQAAAAGSGSVTAVTGTSPIASSGGATPAISLNDTAVTPGAYGDATHIPSFTVDQKGRLMAASQTAVTFSSWIPLVDGSEPPVFITDGAGHLILVAYP